MARQSRKAGPTYDNIPDLTAWLRGIWESCPPDESVNDDGAAAWPAPFNRGEKRLREMRPRDLRDALAKVEFYRWYEEAAGAMDVARHALEAVSHDLQVLSSKCGGGALAKNADMVEVHNIAFHMEDTLRPIEQVQSALVLLAESRNSEPDMSHALYLLRDTLEVAIEKVTNEIDLIAQKTAPFTDGRLVAVPGEQRAPKPPLSSTEIAKIMEIVDGPK
jgi:hypothetical protein